MAGKSSTLFVLKEAVSEVRRRLKRYQHFNTLTTAWVQACLALALAARSSGGRPHEGASTLIPGVKKNGITRLTKQTGFQQRQGLLTPYDFLVLLTLGQLGLPHSSLGGWWRQSPRASVEKPYISALQLRRPPFSATVCTPCSGTNFSRCRSTPNCQPFVRVLVVDSSRRDVSEKLCAVLPGSGATPPPPIASSKRRMTTRKAN